MIRSIPVFVAALILIAGLTAASTAAALGNTQPDAVFALHAVAHPWPPVHGAPCDAGKPTIPCRNYRVTWPVKSSADVYLVVAQAQPGPGIAGISCGIHYNPAAQQGVDMFGWSLCADMEFTNAGDYGEWPASGGGNRITWSAVDACQRTVINPDGVHAIAGAFYVYAYTADWFSVTRNENLTVPELAVADCTAQATYFSYRSAGWVGFGDEGWNPCEGWFIPTEPTTWGRLKTKY